MLEVTLMMMVLQVSMLTGQVAELQKSLSSLQEETDSTITKLRAELHDKATIVETLQQQIRMKMFMNLTQQKNPMIAALADLQGEETVLYIRQASCDQCKSRIHEMHLESFNWTATILDYQTRSLHARQIKFLLGFLRDENQ